MNRFFKRRSIDDIISTSSSGTANKLERSMNVWSIIIFGVGAMVGAGLFARTAAAAANGAGSGVIFSFIIAAVACAFTGFCYAELATLIPISGSAYAYSSVAMGRGIGWIVGWALMQEYSFSVPALAIAVTQYGNELFNGTIPWEWLHSPLSQLVKEADGTTKIYNIWNELPENHQILNKGIMNLPAVVIIILLTILLIRGTKESSIFNGIVVILKLAIVLLFILIGWNFINPANVETLYIPKGEAPYDSFFHHGIGGILLGAGTVFFAFIGFDAVSTTVQEVKNPQKDMPRGILGSLFFCVIFYILFSYVLTGILSYKELATTAQEAPISKAIEHMQNFTWLQPFINVAIIASFLSVMLAMLYGQSRILLAMSNDKLLPPTLTKIHPKYKTPYVSSIVILIFTSILAAFLPGDLVGDITSFGTLFAFIFVCLSVIILRKIEPSAPRAFKTPLVPLFPILGILFCLILILSLDSFTLIISSSWIVISIIIYVILHSSRNRWEKLKL